MLYYPNEIMKENSEPIFDKRGNRKMFFPFREIKQEETYQKLTDRIKNAKKVNPTEALQTKLNWNSKIQSKQSQAIKEMSTKTFTELMTTARQWKIKTQRNPIVIKR